MAHQADAIAAAASAGAAVQAVPGAPDDGVGAHAKAHLKYRKDVDGLRAVAVLAVVLFHAFPSRFPAGFVGVDVFFVISGFLISTIIFTAADEGRFSFAEFYARRIRRIFPALLLVLATCLVMGYPMLLPDLFQALGRDVASGAAFVSNLTLWKTEDYFGTDAELNPLLHLWSLGVEEQYYIIFPMLAALLWTLTRHRLALLVGAVLASFTLNVLLVERSPVATFYLPVTRFWEILVGSVLAYVTSFGWRRSGDGVRVTLPSEGRGNDVAGWAGVALVLAALMLLSPQRAFPGWWALLPTLGSALVIGAGPKALPNRVVLSHPGMVFVGLISYPLYLWHWPILVFARHRRLETLSAIETLGLVAVAMLLATATWRFVERPIREGRSTTAATLKWGLVAGAAVAALGLGAWSTLIRRELAPAEQRLADVMEQERYYGIYERGTCFLDYDQTAADYQRARCTAVPPDASPGRVLIFGDSYAAHLFPGLDGLLAGRAEVFQYTATSCRPVRVAGRRCREFYEGFPEILTATDPDLVVLSAAWSGLFQDERAQDPLSSLASLDELVAAVRSRGAALVLVGQSPQFHFPVPSSKWPAVRRPRG